MSIPHRPAFHVDMSACTGCKTCVVACLDAHAEQDGGPDAPARRRVAEYTHGDWQCRQDGTYSHTVSAWYLSASCHHCAEPLCVAACPTGAMRKEQSGPLRGVVRVDHQHCTACGRCTRACPYGAPRLNLSGLKGRKLVKCDLCAQRLHNSALPVCVEACPMRALHFGEYAELSNHAHCSLPPQQATSGPGLLLTLPRAVYAVMQEEGLSLPFTAAFGQTPPATLLFPVNQEEW